MDWNITNLMYALAADVAALCKNLANFGSVTPEFMRVKNLTFGTAGVDKQWS